MLIKWNVLIYKFNKPISYLQLNIKNISVVERDQSPAARPLGEEHCPVLLSHLILAALIHTKNQIFSIGERSGHEAVLSSLQNLLLKAILL